jgi:hypothetical protein
MKRRLGYRWLKASIAALLVAALLTTEYIPVARADTMATPDVALNDMWNSYGNQGGHWTGGDETVSVALPDGRIAWLFSDTFQGTVASNYSRPANTPFIHNCMVIQQGDRLTTLTGGTASAPTSLVGATTDGNPDDAGYWVNDAFVTDNNLEIFYTHYLRIGKGALDIKQVGTALAMFSLPDLSLRSVTPISIGTSLKWGAAVLNQPDYTYIYGIEDTATNKFLHLARSPHGQVLMEGNNPTAAWQFWTGNGWSSSPSDSTRIISGVGDGFSMIQMGNQYVLITQDLHQIFSPNLVAYAAITPMGPFGNQVNLYSTPETEGNIITYDVRAHPEINRVGKLVISYNVNSLRYIDTYTNVWLYRPRFIDITWPVTSPLVVSKCHCR